MLERGQLRWSETHARFVVFNMSPDQTTNIEINRHKSKNVKFQSLRKSRAEYLPKNKQIGRKQNGQTENFLLRRVACGGSRVPPTIISSGNAIGRFKARNSTIFSC